MERIKQPFYVSLQMDNFQSHYYMQGSEKIASLWWYDLYPKHFCNEKKALPLQIIIFGAKSYIWSNSLRFQLKKSTQRNAAALILVSSKEKFYVSQPRPDFLAFNSDNSVMLYAPERLI